MRVGRVGKLHGHPSAGRIFHNFLRFFDGSFHAFFAGREFQVGPVGRHQATALDAHALGHHQRELVALHGRYQGQAHARVAGSGFHNQAAFGDEAVLFGLFHHGEGNPVLDGAAGIGAFQLHPHLHIGAGGGKQAVDTHQRGATNGFENGICFHWGDE